jgi:hypothetical protein
MEILHFDISSEEIKVTDNIVYIWSMISSSKNITVTDILVHIRSMISGIVLKFTAKTYDDTVPIYKIVLDFINMNGGIY